MAKTYLPNGAGAPFKNIIRFIGGKPLDGRMVVDTYSDIQGENFKSLFTNLDTDGITSITSYYTGMLVVTADTGKLYVLVDKTRMVEKGDGSQVQETYQEFDEVTPDLSNIHGSITANSLAEAQSKATENNLGQIIYVNSNDDAKGAYVVSGAGVVSKLASTTASGDLAADVEAIKQSIAALKIKDINSNDKVLSLTDGILSSNLRYERATVEGKDSLVLYGKNDVVIGSVPVADFLADGMLQNVELNNNKLVFTFNVDVDEEGGGSDSNTKTIEVDLANYIKPYTGDGTHVKVENNVISLVNPFTAAHAETLSTAVQSSVFNPWKEEVDQKISDLEAALEDAGKVDDVQFAGATIVENKVANINNIFASEVTVAGENATEEELVAIAINDAKGLTVGVAKAAFLLKDEVTSLTNSEISDILNETEGE